MVLGGRRLAPWMGLLLFVAVITGSVVFLFHPSNRNAGALVQALVVITTAAAGAACWQWTRPPPARAVPSSLDPAVDELAKQLRRQWDRASIERGLTYPEPIPVQWRWSPRQVTGPKAEAVAKRFAALPGKPEVTVGDLQSGS